MFYDLFQQDSALFLTNLFFSLILTLFVYGFFPLVFAMHRKKEIKKKKYKRICFLVNLVPSLFFCVLNGGTNFAAYLLWSTVFSYCGVKILISRGLLVDSNIYDDEDDYIDENPNNKKVFVVSKPENDEFCERCGADITKDTDSCHVCGEKIKFRSNR